MSILQWFTRNWADTDEGSDPALAPLPLPVPPDQALAHINSTVSTLPHWRMEKSDEQARTLHATRRTRLFRFVDDVYLRLEESAGGTLVHARSQSRVGKGDLGQNRRNILELFKVLSRN
jgi:uncharacterized protein (DUF1499 family)